MDLKTFLLRNVDAEYFYRDEVEGYEPGKNIPCPFHDDEAPSLSIDDQKGSDGRFVCYACGAKGTSWIGFYTKKHGLDGDFKNALQRLYVQYVRPIVPEKDIDFWHTELLKTPSILEWLEIKRGIELETVKKFKLGYDSQRITIPVYTEWGFAVNVRRYDFTGRQETKILSYAKGYGGASLYPLPRHGKSGRTYLFEGELDTILAHQYGLNGLTSTGGVRHWLPEFSNRLRNGDVTICYDVNDPSNVGQVTASERASVLRGYGCTVRNVILPISTRGGDFTDFIVKHSGSVESFRKLEVEASELAPIKEREGRKSEPPIFLGLGESSSAEYYGRRIQVVGHVVGKDVQPYGVPKKVKLSCNTKPDRMCDFCTGVGGYSGTFDVDQSDPAILNFVGTTELQLGSRVRSMAGCSHKCKVEMEVLEIANVEEVTLVPELDIDAGNAPYVLRRGFTLGQGLEGNRTYVFEGVATPDPKSQHMTYLFDDTETAYDTIESFELTPEIRESLAQFRTEDIAEAQSTRYKRYSKGITNIYGRPNLHEAIDLVYFSPLSFNFNGRLIRKGWLEVLIVGDTRTGKGFVAEGLHRFYGLGEVASSENCSFAGLIGGMQQVGAGRNWSITWGIIPRNDRRMVILDEVSALNLEDIARMSRIRSEGIAEIVKIHAEKTHARTRLVWLGNPRDERQISQYEYGVEAVRKLIGKSEDISRFDYAYIVAHGDVDDSLINAYRGDVSGEHGLAGVQQASKNLILWVWSRNSDQVRFDEESTRQILRASKWFSDRYSPTIPLVQAENFSEKLARVSAAVAGRTFSTDDTGEILYVSRACVEYAARLLVRLFDFPGMGYNDYSDYEREMGNLVDIRGTAEFFESLGERCVEVINLMLDNSQFNVSRISEIFNVDRYESRNILFALSAQRALRAKGSWYVKTPQFIKWLKAARKTATGEVANAKEG